MGLADPAGLLVVMCHISHQALATLTTSPWYQHSLLQASSRLGWSGASAPMATKGSSVSSVLLATGGMHPTWGRSASACPATATVVGSVTRILVRKIVTSLSLLGV